MIDKKIIIKWIMIVKNKIVNKNIESKINDNWLSKDYVKYDKNKKRIIIQNKIILNKILIK